MRENRRHSFHSVFHRWASGVTDSASRFQVPQNEGLTGITFVNSGVIHQKKAARQIARGPRSSLTGRKNSALIKLKTP